MKEKIILLIAIVCSCIYFTSLYVKSTLTPQVLQLPQPTFEEVNNLLPDEVNNINIYNQIAPSVVNVTCIKSNQPFLASNEEPNGGSGFIWDKNGHIVTNFHVIQNTNKIYISINADNIQYPAVVVGWAPRKDIAVLKIDAQNSSNPYQLENLITSWAVRKLSPWVIPLGSTTP